jgi:hypothetical protein
VIRHLRVLLTLIRTEGIGEVVHRLVFRFRHVHTFIVMRVFPAAGMPRGEFPPGVEFKRVTREELDRLREGRNDLPDYFYRDRTEPLERCWVALHEGRLAFIIFTSDTGSSNFVKLGPTEVEIAFPYCLEELRGKRITGNAVKELARTLYDEGVTAILVVANSMNPAVLKSFAAGGMAPIAEIKRYGFITRPQIPLDCSRLPQPRAASSSN